MNERINSDLHVAEYGGTARSGKGTIVSHLEQAHERVVAIETGKDYRVITRKLIDNKVIKLGMDQEAVNEELAPMSIGEFSVLIAQRDEMIAQDGDSSLYEPIVNTLVSLVSPIDHVRTAVKEGFKAHVKEIRDDDTHDVLVVDGRNLAATIQEIEGTRLIMRTFVSCLPIEAALRECHRDGVDLMSPEGQHILQTIRTRNENDATRECDAVRPDDDAFYYRHIDKYRMRTIRYYANAFYEGNVTQALEAMSIQPHGAHHEPSLIGAGALAATTGRQIDFDTTYFRAYADPKEGMLQVAERMFNEAFDTALLNS